MTRVVILRQEGSDEPNGLGTVERLADMQAIVGGDVECVMLEELDDGSTVDLWCNEEFLYDPSMQFNPVATSLALGKANLTSVGIRGDCFVCCSGEGESTDITDEWVDKLRAASIAVGQLWAEPNDSVAEVRDVLVLTLLELTEQLSQMTALLNTFITLNDIDKAVATASRMAQASTSMTQALVALRAGDRVGEGGTDG